MPAMNEQHSPWRTLGEAIGSHRMRAGLSKRAAAQKAGFSESTWRQLEEGVRRPTPGVEVEMSARAETVVAAALAVGMEPAKALAVVGIELSPGQLEQLVTPQAGGGTLDGLLLAVMNLTDRLDVVVSLLEAQATPPPVPASRRAPAAPRPAARR